MPANRRIAFRPSRLRLVLWGACLAVVVWLLFQSVDSPSGADATDRADATTPSTAATEPVTPGGPLRFGVLGRTAHVVPLFGLGAEIWYPAAVAYSDRDGIRADVFASAAELRDALRAGNLDVACVPLRDAVLLQLELGDAAPKVIAGAARGDEQFVLGRDLTNLPLGDLGEYRVALVEPAELDVAQCLGLGAAEAPAVLRADADGVSSLLAQGRADFAVLAAPFADAAAATSGSRVAAPDEVAAAGTCIQGGAVLVATRAFLAAEPELTGLLLQQHELAARVAAKNLDEAVAVAAEVVRRDGGSTPPDLIWVESVARIRLGTDIPLDELTRLADGARARGMTVPDGAIEALVDASHLEKARREVAEIVAEK
jgi:ABC-type nitrate/sulfonate/bicarbonate transport system substrate-binding protein